MEKEVESRIPKSLITLDGKITDVMRGLLVGGFAYSEASVIYTTWLHGPGHLVYDRYTPNAITWFNRVYYSDQWLREDNLKTWMRYIVHEQRHRHDVHEKGGTSFYFSYLRDYVRQKRIFKDEHKAYLNISWEQKAYEDEGIMLSVMENTDFLFQWEKILSKTEGFTSGFEIGKQFLAPLLSARKFA